MADDRHKQPTIVGPNDLYQGASAAPSPVIIQSGSSKKADERIMKKMKLIAPTALGVLIALTASALVRAQCFGFNRYEQGQCVEYRTCTPGTSGPSAPSASYGAIA